MEIELKITVTEYERPQFFYSKNGLPTVTFKGDKPRYKRQRFIAFGKMAELISEEVNKEDKLIVYGRYSTFSWKDHLGKPRSRIDFIVQKFKIDK